MDATDFLVWGIFLHLVADWVLQNDWMARNKSRLTHPSAWVHGGIHALLMLTIFPLWLAACIGLFHIIIDTGWLAKLWQSIYRQTRDGPWALSVSIWLDQVFHIAVLTVASFLAGVT
jgi:hypothetical protein